MDHLDAILEEASTLCTGATPAFSGWPSDGDPEALAAFAHEIRTPLATINATLELLTDDAPLEAEGMRQLVARLQRGVIWITNLVENLNAWSAMRDGRLTLARSETEVRDWVEQAVALVQPLLERRGQSVLLACPKPSPRVAGDAFRLSQVIVNLLTNASRYGAWEDTIAITVIDAGEAVEVRISDHGPGIPEHERELIFAPGMRGSCADMARDGQGLGLAIVRGIVDLHGGAVGVDSQPGRGTTAWVRLPVLS